MYGRGRSANSAKVSYGPHPTAANYSDFWKFEAAMGMEQLKAATEAQDARTIKLYSRRVREAKQHLTER